MALGTVFCSTGFRLSFAEKAGFINGNPGVKKKSSARPCRAEIMGVALSSCSPVKISGTRRALPDSEGPLQMFCLARRNSLSTKPPHVGACQAGRTQPVISDSPKCHRRTPLFIFTPRILFLVFCAFLRLAYKIVSRRLKAARRRGLHGLSHRPPRKAPCYHTPPQEEAWQDSDGGAAAYERARRVTAGASGEACMHPCSLRNSPREQPSSTYSRKLVM